MKHIFYKAITILTAVVLSFQPFQASAGINDIFKGWAWTPNIGWVSMNSTNTNAINAYGVTLDDGRNASGWAWSANLGWICFGSTCPGVSPDGTVSWAVLDSAATPALHGWARIYSLYTINPAGVEGWISLNCASLAGHPARNVCAAANYSVWTLLSDGLFHGWGWNCTTTDGTSGCNGTKYTGGVGWIQFGTVSAPPYNVPDGTFGGVPWVQVLYGDLYAKGGVSTPSPFTQHFAQLNAYYCLDNGSGAVIRFTQGDISRCATGTVNIDINAPKQGTNYSNVLGRIKLRGYSAALTPLSLIELAAGKYGPWKDVDVLDDDVANILGNKVYDTVAFGDWTMSAKTFNNAVGTGSGAGLIIVRGNLTISGDLLYQNAIVTKLPQLASLGILVLDDGSGIKGNVTIAPGVKTISASIYAEGTITTGTTGNPITDQPLTVNGVVIAKKFNFQRQYPGGVDKPSEKIVYDGRIVANTPPGLADFTASLPIISY